MTRFISLIAVLVLCLTVLPFAAVSAEDTSARAPEDAPEVEINSINFPDDIFRQYILDQGYDRDRDMILSAAELAAVTEMDCAGPAKDDHKIRDLSGIEYFRALTSLDCSGNLLKELVVRNLAKLKYLDCSGNEIASLDTSLNFELETLYCRNNSMTTLKASGCYSLITLECEDNDLTSLDLNYCTSLDNLYCQSNDLKVLDVTNTPMIRNYILTTPRVDVDSHIAYGEYPVTEEGSGGGQVSTLYHVEMDPETTPFSNDTGRSLDIGMNADPFLVTTLIFAYLLTRYFAGGRKDGWFED